MPLTGEIYTVYLDKEKTIPVFPRTVTEAITDSKGNNLDDLLSYIDVEAGYADIASKTYVNQKISEIPKVDLTNYATKEYVDSNTISTYVHTAGALSGSGVDGKFKATTSETISSIIVNGVTCSINCGGEDSVELVKDCWYTFILDGNTVNFKSGGGLSNSKLALATASTADVLSGKEFYAGDKEIKTGTMINNGAVSQSLNAGGSYTIPAGYHNGSGKITANSLASQTDGTATAAQILKDQTAYVDGVKVTGTMANNGAVSKSLSINGSYTIPAGYHDGNGTVKQSVVTRGALTYGAKTSAQTIKAGQYLSGDQTIAAVTQSGLSADKILKGTTVKISSNGSDLWNVEGTLETTASTSIWGGARITSLSGFTVGKRYLISVVYDNGATISLSNCTVHARGGNFWSSYGQDIFQFIVTANATTIGISGNANSNWSVATALALN